MTKNKKKGSYRFLIYFLIRLLLLGAAIYLTLTYILVPFRMSGNSMFPMVKDGDLCIYFLQKKPAMNDVVLYEGQDGRKKAGRITGIPGQVIDFPEEGGFLVNGYTPSEEIPYETYAAKDSSVHFPVTLNEGEYFIMNDFRSDTSDSRSNGAVKEEKVHGVLIFIFRRRGF